MRRRSTQVVRAALAVVVAAAGLAALSTTTSAVNAPNALTPSRGPDAFPSPVLAWNRVADAPSYDMQVASTSAFSPTLFTKTTTTGRSCRPRCFPRAPSTGACAPTLPPGRAPGRPRRSRSLPRRHRLRWALRTTAPSRATDEPAVASPGPRFRERRATRPCVVAEHQLLSADSIWPGSRSDPRCGSCAAPARKLRHGLCAPAHRTCRSLDRAFLSPGPVPLGNLLGIDPVATVRGHHREDLSST